MFKEYQNKNIAIVLIDNNNKNENKVISKEEYKIKIISKSLNIVKNLKNNELNKKIIFEIKEVRLSI